MFLHISFLYVYAIIMMSPIVILCFLHHVHHQLYCIAMHISCHIAFGHSCLPWASCALQLLLFDPLYFTHCSTLTWFSPSFQIPKCYFLRSLLFLYLSCISTSPILTQTLFLMQVLYVQPPSKILSQPELIDRVFEFNILNSIHYVWFSYFLHKCSSCAHKSYLLCRAIL